jgi:hypothetical protein
MFYLSEFNGDISQWKIDSLVEMNSMFFQSEFNGDLSNWNVSNVDSMIEIFSGSKFRGDISSWPIKNNVQISKDLKLALDRSHQIQSLKQLTILQQSISAITPQPIHTL